MSILNNDAFIDEIISELEAMKADPDRDTVAKVIAMVFRVARKHNDNTALKRSFLTALMSLDGINPDEMETLKRWDEESKNN